MRIFPSLHLCFVVFSPGNKLKPTFDSPYQFYNNDQLTADRLPLQIMENELKHRAKSAPAENEDMRRNTDAFIRIFNGIIDMGGEYFMELYCHLRYKNDFSSL